MKLEKTAVALAPPCVQALQHQRALMLSNNNCYFFQDQQIWVNTLTFTARILDGTTILKVC